ncbi:hypothetical protein L21SP2_0658 [Salinispira pacifica]|uniref:Uncharacterized protein n=1 Tax=Salinispira pacifica TaxID=1307761 RepID=V5WE72_9SPIO|nr:hypothetical protein L21SP2_0658 [Salinispira pacifica]
MHNEYLAQNKGSITQLQGYFRLQGKTGGSYHAAGLPRC